MYIQRIGLLVTDAHRDLPESGHLGQPACHVAATPCLRGEPWTLRSGIEQLLRLRMLLALFERSVTLAV